MEEDTIADSSDVRHVSGATLAEDYEKAELRWTETVQEPQVVAARMDGRTASGSDGIPSRLIQLLGPKALIVLAEAISMVLKGTVVTPSWQVSRLKPLYKGAGDRRDPANYRPICVTQVLYRVTMQVTRWRLKSCWRRWRGCWGLFRMALGRASAGALQEKHQFLAAFLDISKAYDTVDGGTLSQQLKTLGLYEEYVDVDPVNVLLGDHSVRVEWNGI